MAFEIKIKTGGAAFRSNYETDENGEFILDPYGREVRRIIDKVVTDICYGKSCGKVVDINGNICGEWKYED